jgi:hypothetical protein
MELKAAGMDWRAVLASEEAENERAKLARDVVECNSYASTTERVQAFEKGGGACRGTFFDYSKKLAKAG